MSSRSVLERIAYLSFVLLGLSATIHGVAMPFLLDAFSINLGIGGLLFFAQSLGYIMASSTFPWVVLRLGSYRLIALGILFAAITLFIIPFSSTWFIVLVITIVAGFGFSSFDVGLNAVVANLPREQSNRTMHWLHFSFSVGALIGPILLVRLFVLSGEWRSFYFLGSFLLFTLYLLWQRADFPVDDLRGVSSSENKGQGPYKSIWFWLLMICMFFYCGAEVALASWITTYFVQELAAPVELGAMAVSLFWGGLTLGRGLAGFISSKINIHTFLMILFGGAAFNTLALSLVDQLFMAMFFVFLAGFFFSAVFPSLILYGTAFFSKHPHTISGGMFTAAGIGSLVIPATVGFVGDSFSLTVGLLVLSSLLLLSLVLILIIPKPVIPS